MSEKLRHTSDRPLSEKGGTSDPENELSPAEQTGSRVRQDISSPPRPHLGQDEQPDRRASRGSLCHSLRACRRATGEVMSGMVTTASASPGGNGATECTMRYGASGRTSDVDPEFLDSPNESAPGNAEELGGAGAVALRELQGLHDRSAFEFVERDPDLVFQARRRRLE